MREARYAGWGGALGNAILDGSETLESLEAKVASGQVDPRPVSGQQELLENVVNQSIWAADRTHRSDAGADGVGFVLGIDVSTTATKAVLVDESGAVRGVGTSEYGFSVPRPLWSEQDPGLWWDGAVAAIGAVMAATGATGADVVAIGLTGQMHGLVLLDEADACSARRSSGTTSARPRSATRSARRSGPSGSSRSLATTRSPGSRRPSSSGFATMSRTSGRRSRTCSSRRTSCASG